VGLAAGQAAWPAEQLWPQTPPEHFCPAAQAVPQAPQFCGSVWKFVQNAARPLPQAFGVAPGQAQAPFVHPWPSGHAWPQVPQFDGSLPVVAQ
jgi:hypothetical protein